MQFSLLLVTGTPEARAEQPFVALNLPAPSLFSTKTDWVNTGGRNARLGKGQVHIVHFWAYGCINCKRNLPAYDKWYRQYAQLPVSIVGIHTPETDKERVRTNVEDAIRKHNIIYPVLIDGNSVNWRRWKQRWWPTVYLVDKNGYVRYYWKGELEWNNGGGTKIMERCINELVREPYNGIIEPVIEPLSPDEIPDGTPYIVSADPPNGAVEVTPGVAELHLTFNCDMRKDCDISGYPTLRTIGKPEWRDPATLIINIRLEEETDYVLLLNQTAAPDFASIEEIALLPVRWSFTTGKRE